MSGSISEFKSSFTSELARPNRFEAIIVPPVGLVGYLGDIFVGQNLRYRCETASLPSRTLATLDQKTYGPIEKFPYLNTYTDLDLTFIVESDMKQKIVFDTWLDYVNPLSDNNFKFKSDYGTVLTVVQYDLQNNPTYAVDFFDA